MIDICCQIVGCQIFQVPNFPASKYPGKSCPIICNIKAIREALMMNFLKSFKAVFFFLIIYSWWAAAHKKGLLWGRATNYWSRPLAPPEPRQLHHCTQDCGLGITWLRNSTNHDDHEGHEDHEEQDEKTSQEFQISTSLDCITSSSLSSILLKTSVP